jgi:hypothetical protein
MAAPDEYYEEFEGPLQCEGTIAGVLKHHLGIRCLEHKCHSPKCTKGRAVAVFHYYSLETGERVDTVVYQDPTRRFRK